MSKLLIDEPLKFRPSLAVKFGVNEALMVDHLHGVATPLGKKDNSLWAKTSYEELGKAFPFWSDDTIKRTIASCIQAELISKSNRPKLTPYQAKAAIAAKLAQTFSTIHATTLCCEWCTGATIVLHAHHFPVPRCDGGTETVNICPNCHAEYHALTNDSCSFIVHVILIDKEAT